MRGLSQRRRIRRPRAEPAAASGVVIKLIEGTRLEARERASLLRRLSVALLGSARAAGAQAVASGRWLTDTVVDFAPHIPVRDLPTISAHHNGLVGDRLAQALIESAAHATAAVGAAGGLIATLEYTAPPTLIGSPVQLAAETIAVVAIEIKLVAELHEVYGQGVQGTPAVQAAAYLGAWTRRRGLGPRGAGGLPGILTGAARRQLRRRLIRRGAENSVTILPFMAGAVAGASLNARETRKLGEALCSDLRVTRR